MGDLASWAHPGTIIGDSRSHGNYWLDRTPPEHCCWIGCNPVHGTFHFGARWFTPVDGIPELHMVANRHHGLFVLQGLPYLRAGQPVAVADIERMEKHLAALARNPEARVDPMDSRRLPLLDILFRAQSGGVHSWISVRDGDLSSPARDKVDGLDRLRCRLASAEQLAFWAHSDGVDWGRPAAHVPVPHQLSTSGSIR
ncbi:hypothetical protein M8C13_38485 [Crossiella sp. SN42]|uniref:hypothetical protein n=1 Tax=Crossiella sp. SN42 TaxID=2944808 RepID=UPI00207C14EA|nr:hypothetical protein [Crossiella sp. SN42]MCO1581653.1 hypothetical protein [Crossiella sp. SN42]